ncbi:MAG: hypothetical protein IJT07_03665 [Oscillospiraceae bacterium]|nr:hypothetical protein [Oscillospiraceae bacterium]
MKLTKLYTLLLALAMLVALVACGSAPTDTVYENGGLKLTVPAEYKDLVVVTMPTEGSELFSVAEKASVEAGQKQHPGEDWGDGWLFSISRLDSSAARQALSGELNTSRIFAKDAEDGYFLLGRPSDVRFVREDYSNIPEEDLAQWGTLNEWAETVPASFVNANESVSLYERTNTTLDQFLNRIAFEDMLVYTLSSTEFGPLEPIGDAGRAQLELLLNEATFTAVDTCEIPDGEYYVLNFPEDGIQFRIYNTANNTVSYITGENAPFCLQGSLPEGETLHDIFGAWYDALAVAHGLK